MVALWLDPGVAYELGGVSAHSSVPWPGRPDGLAAAGLTGGFAFWGRPSCARSAACRSVPSFASPTYALSHEFLEATTNPFGHGWYADVPLRYAARYFLSHGPTSLLGTAPAFEGEVADLCEPGQPDAPAHQRIAILGPSPRAGRRLLSARHRVCVVTSGGPARVRRRAPATGENGPMTGVHRVISDARESLVRQWRPVVMPALVLWVLAASVSTLLLHPCDVLEYKQYAHAALHTPLFHRLPLEYPAPALVLFLLPLLLPFSYPWAFAVSGGRRAHRPGDELRRERAWPAGTRVARDG